MKYFYYAADWGFGSYADVENVLVSAGSMYNKKLTLNKGMIPKSTKRLFLDSGGYSFFSKWANYPFTIEEYVDFANMIRDEYPLTEVATMDLPCEPHVNRQSVRSNIDRIITTVDNAQKCIDADKTLPWVPVIQGYTLFEYGTCINLYNDLKLSPHLWAIGTLCARKKTGGIKRIIISLKDMIKGPIHTFGMNMTALSDPQIFFAIRSSDSGTWSFNAKAKDKPHDLLRFKQKMKSLIDGYSAQTTLGEYTND